MIFSAIQVVLIIVAAVCLFAFTVWAATRILEWWDIKQDLKWDVNLFPIPEEIPELEPFQVKRSINLNNRVFTFYWESNGNSSTRTYRFISVKTALKHYERIFKAEERKFYERNHKDFAQALTAHKRIDALEQKIENMLNQGNDND